VNHWGFTVVTLNVYTKVDSCPPIFPLTWLITSSSTKYVYIRTFYQCAVCCFSPLHRQHPLGADPSPLLSTDRNCLRFTSVPLGHWSHL